MLAKNFERLKRSTGRTSFRSRGLKVRNAALNCKRSGKLSQNSWQIKMMKKLSISDIKSHIIEVEAGFHQDPALCRPRQFPVLQCIPASLTVSDLSKANTKKSQCFGLKS
jgi:hypothetical protein